MVFAGAAVAASCGSSQKKTNDVTDDQTRGQRELDRDPNYQNHPCYDPDPKRIAELEKQRDEATTEEEKARIEQELQIARQPMCAPYGAPPARRRVV
jgi:hypothetical protein